MVETPRIGLSMYGPDDDPVAPAVSLPLAYSEAVARSGGLPLLLPPIPALCDALLPTLDALILAGGGDIDPALHTDRGHPSVYMVNSRRDQFELELARRALARPELPVLGICRGMQLLNLATGGDLELHLPDAKGERVAHRLPPRTPVLHDVTLERDTELARIYGEPRLSVCSWHHQGIRRLGRDWVVTAHAADGVIEAIEHTQHPFALGVQWHPEMQADDPYQPRLFDALVERARRTR